MKVMMDAITTKPLKLSRSKLIALSGNTHDCAEAVNLVYVTGTEDGIKRIVSSDGFAYEQDGRRLRNKEQLTRIAHLRIPPAWTNVWICPLAGGHLQVTGYDVRGRKQYIYHPLWNTIRSQTKFFHLYDFATALPAIRRRVAADLSLPGLPLRKVLAAIVSVMECTGIRIGNNLYEKLYGSFGLTTLKDKHVSITGATVKFSFRGKKGVYHDISLKSRKLSRIVSQCRDIPGKELFQYYDEKGGRHAVDSGMVNSYIREISAGAFTSKDLRTWTGTLCAFRAFRDAGCCGSDAEIKKKMIGVFDKVASHLGNTRTVCKKYYIHPLLTEYFANRTLEKYFSPCDDKITASYDSSLCADEIALLRIIEDARSVEIAA